MNLNEKLWWFRYFLAILASALTAYLTLTGFFQGFMIGAFFLAVAIYVLSYFIARYLWKIKPEQLPKKRDLALYGVFAYFIAWFVFWILFYTLAKIFGS